jgi:hypothetical protein
MNDKQMGLLIGGFLPAILFGICGALPKVINRDVIGVGPYLMGLGLSIFIMGALVAGISGNFAFTTRSAGYIFLFGVFWAGAMAAVAIALRRYGSPIGQLVSIYNMNTLVTVLIGLLVFAEWRNVNSTRLLASVVLIVGGGVLAAQA